MVFADILEYVQTLDFIMVAGVSAIFLFTIILLLCVCCRFHQQRRRSTINLGQPDSNKTDPAYEVPISSVTLSRHSNLLRDGIGNRLYEDIEDDSVLALRDSAANNEYLELHDSTYISPAPIGPEPPKRPPAPPAPPTDVYMGFEPKTPPALCTTNVIGPGYTAGTDNTINSQVLQLDDDEDNNDTDNEDVSFESSDVLRQLDYSTEQTQNNRLTQCSESDELEFVVKIKTKTKRKKTITK